MSASRAAAEACSVCGADLPRHARFCGECGASVEEQSGTTMRVELPPDETGPVPISISRSEPHWFGVAPPGWLAGGSLAAFVVALFLFANGHWPYGLIFLGVAALFAAAFLESARRRPRSALTRVSADARERAASLVERLRAHSSAAIEARRAESGLALIREERRSAVYDLGAAADRGDAEAEAAARARIAELDERADELRRRQAEGLEAFGERIRRARLTVDRTMLVVPNEASQPYPPPDEGNPPTPEPVPEPYPPPDEGDPPQPQK
jgi:hypothetical protein